MNTRLNIEAVQRRAGGIYVRPKSLLAREDMLSFSEAAKRLEAQRPVELVQTSRDSAVISWKSDGWRHIKSVDLETESRTRLETPDQLADYARFVAGEEANSETHRLASRLQPFQGHVFQNRVIQLLPTEKGLLDGKISPRVGPGLSAYSAALHLQQNKPVALVELTIESNSSGEVQLDKKSVMSRASIRYIHTPAEVDGLA